MKPALIAEWIMLFCITSAMGAERIGIDYAPSAVLIWGL
jgi:hypothetical protein